MKSDTSIAISYKLSCISGKVRLVLIDTENKSTTIAETTSQKPDESLQKINLDLKKGINKIKMTAEDYTDVNLEFRQTGKTFKYTEGFPFEPLFGNEGVFGKKSD